MSDAIRSGGFKCFQSFLDSISLLFNQPTANHKATPIKSIMTMYTNFCIIHPFRFGSSETLLYNRNESLYIFFRGRNFGCCGEFMIRNRSVMERRRIVDSIDAVWDIDYVTDLGILTDEMEWRMSLICLTERLYVSFSWSWNRTFIARRGDRPMRSDTLWTFIHWNQSSFREACTFCSFFKLHFSPAV